MNLFTYTVWFFLPAWIANISVTFWWYFRIRYEWWDKPLDSGKTLLGNRILGDAVTIVGFFLSIFSGGIIGLLQGRKEGFIIGITVYLGNGIASFCKRRAGIKRGGYVPIIDHTDYVIATIIFFSFFGLRWEVSLIGFLMTLVIHPTVCYVGYKLRIKNDPW